MWHFTVRAVRSGGLLSLAEVVASAVACQTNSAAWKTHQANLTGQVRPKDFPTATHLEHTRFVKRDPKFTRFCGLADQPWPLLEFSLNLSTSHQSGSEIRSPSGPAWPFLGQRFSAFAKHPPEGCQTTMED